MAFDVADIRDAFGPLTFERGLEYFRQRRVLWVTGDGHAFRGEVLGSVRDPYDVKLVIRNKRQLDGACNCPVAYDCKHAAALALAVHSQQRNVQRDAADGAVDSWIESMSADASKTHRQPPQREHMRYTIEVSERYYVPTFRLAAFTVPVLKSGALGSGRPYQVANLEAATIKAVTPIDRTIGRLASAAGVFGGLRSISPPLLGTLLEILIDTGRLHWQSIGNPTLLRAALEDGTLEWRVDADGRQRAHLAGSSDGVLLPSSPLWYVDPQRNVAGPLRTQFPRELEHHLATAPSFTPEQARRVQLELRSVFQAKGIAGPIAAIDAHVIDRNPQPVLRLGVAAGSFARADLLFAYGNQLVRPGDPQRQLRFTEGPSVSTWPRKMLFERAAAQRLQAASFSPAGSPDNADHNEERRWIAFLTNIVPQLQNDGWRIETDDNFPYALVEAHDEWHAELTQPDDSPWFEFDLGINVEGKRVSLLPLLVSALREHGIASSTDLKRLEERTEPVAVRLGPGKYLALPAARVARLLGTLVDLFEGEEALTAQGRLPVAPIQAGMLRDVEGDAKLRWHGDLPLRSVIETLAQPQTLHFEPPPQFLAVLRPYQNDGAAWLQFLRKHGFGGVLADDMGLGKTVQLLAHVCAEKAAGRLKEPVLIVAPTSVVPNWRAEIARFAPHLRVVSLTGCDRGSRFAGIDEADIALSTYALLPRDGEMLLEREWSIAVLDEAQAIKNPRAKAALVATQLRARQRLALTGTPIENHLEELWSIYAFALPELLGDRARFSRNFRTPIEKHGDTFRRTALAARLRPFFLRRTKDLVESELPEKTEIVQRVELEGAQRDLYETIRLAMHKRVRDEIARRGLARSRIVVLEALLKLRQVCCDPRLVKLPAAANVHESQKLAALLEMLESLIDDGRRVLLFSQFTSMLDLIKPELR